MVQERKPFLFGANRNTHHYGQSASSLSSVTRYTPLTRRTTQGRGGNAPRGRGGPAKRGGGGGGSSAQNSQEKPKREAILDLSKYVNTEIKITFQGGRQGILAESLVIHHSHDDDASNWHPQRLRPASQSRPGQCRRALIRSASLVYFRAVPK